MIIYGIKSMVKDTHRLLFYIYQQQGKMCMYYPINNTVHTIACDFRFQLLAFIE